MGSTHHLIDVPMDFSRANSSGEFTIEDRLHHHHHLQHHLQRSHLRPAVTVNGGLVLHPSNPLLYGQRKGSPYNDEDWHQRSSHHHHGNGSSHRSDEENGLGDDDEDDENEDDEDIDILGGNGEDGGGGGGVRAHSGGGNAHAISIP